MTSVGKTSSDIGAGASKLSARGDSLPQSQGHVTRGRHQAPADSLAKLTRFSNETEFGLSPDADSDEAKFLKSFNAVIEQGGKKGDDGSGAEQDGSTAEARIIGYAERPNWTGLPVAATAEPPVAQEPRIKALVETVTQLLTKAISAEVAPQAGQATRLRFALPQGEHGVSHVQVILTNSTLDVVLERGVATASDDLAAAATALAERLLTRFSKRMVRIMDVQRDDPKTDLADEAEALQSPVPVLRS